MQTKVLTTRLDCKKCGKKEVSFLFNLLEEYLIKKTIKLNKNNIKLKIIGDIKPFSTKLKKILINSEKITNDNKKLQINLALNYGSRCEIVNSVNLIKKKRIPFTIRNIEKNLYTSNIPDPELLIRTGNTNRLSNFLLWQAAYAEIFFVKKFWPDFYVSDYYKILNKFKNLKRNFGAL